MDDKFESLAAQVIAGAADREDETAELLRNASMYVGHLEVILAELSARGRGDLRRVVARTIVQAMGGTWPEPSRTAPARLPEASFYPNAPSFGAQGDCPRYAMAFLEVLFGKDSPHEPPPTLISALAMAYGASPLDRTTRVPKHISAIRTMSVGDLVEMDNGQVGAESPMRRDVRQAFVFCMHAGAGTYPHGYGRPAQSLQDATLRMGFQDRARRERALQYLISYGFFEPGEDVYLGPTE